jgi:phosphatidylserine decarboxylase
MTNNSDTKYWNRYLDKEEKEAIYGDRAIRLLYETLAGQKISSLLAKPLFSQLYGFYQQSRLSKNKISPFVSAFNINMKEFEKGPFDSFNDFFIRKFVPNARPFATGNAMPAFAEGRFLAYEKINEDSLYPVKGHYLNAQDLLGRKKEAAIFDGGPIVIARLCPTDYHRFHFPDNGSVIDSWKISGALQSVSPLALKYRGDIFITNERQVTLLQTKTFGRLAYVEVGAMMVGKIVQSHRETAFRRGDEKGYFLFGGSTIILMGEPRKWKLDQDLLENTSKGIETFVHLGDRIAYAI